MKKLKTFFIVSCIVFILCSFSLFAQEPPQNLFVDDTGYATWDSPANRDLLGYNVYLDGVLLEFTTDLFYQYTGLNNTQIYIAGVTALYDEGESTPINYTFILSAGLYPPQTLFINYLGHATWNAPSGYTLQVDPHSSPYWSGTTDGASFTDDSEVRGMMEEDGWMLFDVSGIPDGSIITNIEFNGYVNYTHEPWWEINGVYIDPLTATPADLCAAITNSSNQYNYFQETMGFGPSWKTDNLGGTANEDLAAALANDWFCLGINDTDTSQYYYIYFDGWNETHPPYLIVDYETDDGTIAETSIDMKSKVKHRERMNELSNRDLLGYNVYLDGDFIEFTSDLSWNYTDLTSGQIYTAGISAVYDEGESPILESEFTFATFPPENLNVDNLGFATWEAPPLGDLIELSQHDGNPLDGYWQDFDYAYGVVFNISDYTGVTLEMVDFRHSSWGIYGFWDYSIHIVDWDTYTEIIEVTGLQTTGDDQWEVGIDLGSISESGLVGVFLEPMGNEADDAYPVLDADAAEPYGWSLYGPIYDWSLTMVPSTIGDFLMDLWIMESGTDSIVKIPRHIANLDNNAPKIENTIQISESSIPQQIVRELTGYNLYLDGVFEVFTTDEFYQYTGLTGGQTYTAGVSALYAEGESEIINYEFTYSGTGTESFVATTTKLNNNYPNPFNPTTMISFFTKEAGNVLINIYNMRGQLVKTLVNRELEIGFHEVLWNGRDSGGNKASSGIYFYKMNVGRYTHTKKMILLK